MKTTGMLVIALSGALLIENAIAASGSVHFTGRFVDVEPCGFALSRDRLRESAAETRHCLDHHHAYNMNVTALDSPAQSFEQWLARHPEKGLYQINIRYH